MEKRANNLTSGMRGAIPQCFLPILAFLLTLQTTAQDISYENGKTYILAGLEVTGLQSYNEQTVKTYTGLRESQPITIPGDQISQIINKLWSLELFTDVEFYITRIEGDNIYLELHVEERPTLNNVTLYGVKKGKVDDILNDTDLKKGKKVTQSLISNTKNYLENKYQKDGYLNARVTIATSVDTAQTNSMNMVINVEKGYRDARILMDTVERVWDRNIDIRIKVEEGNKYYFGDIDFVGNSVYTDRQLSQVLGIKKGDTYNGVLLRERIADETKPDGEDLTNLYQNNGYLFSRINPVEISAENDTIDFEIRIIEGKETFLNKVAVGGNDKTNDHVIFRELRTRPGQKYSKDDIIRSVRELGQLGFFDPEQIRPEIENPNPNDGTVDLRFDLVESGASQVELQGGYGGGGFIGTLGLSFNNFSIQNIFNGKAYKPVPMGDGQTFALRLQASRTFRVYSLNFSEPWLGGRKPVRFNLSLSRTQQFLASFDQSGRVQVDKDQQFAITGISTGIAKRVQWPDDFFTVSHALSYQRYDFKNYFTGLFNFGNGTSNALAYTFGLSRSSAGPGFIFPLQGSLFELTAKFTPPYSYLNNKDYASLKARSEELEALSTERPLTPAETAELADVDQERFEWLEFYKIKFRADWYTRVVGKLVLRTNVEFGFLGSYNPDVGKVPFERFFLGGDGLGRNFTLDGREVIQLRGYENSSLTPVDPITQQQEGAIVFNKYSLELRYPLTLKPTASIYALTFLEAGNSFNNFQEYNPFELKRSAGVGLRIFMPAFGLLGIDFGYGFDEDLRPSSVGTGPSGWQTHFIIGQQF